MAQAESKQEKRQEERYEESELYRIRHSAAHVMAQAVVEMFPDAKYTIGPPIEDGFYYDFDLPRSLTPDDLKAIEKRMRKIIAGKHEFKKQVLSAEQAREVFAEQPYKLELIEGLEQGGYDEYGQPLTEKPEISIYTHDDFVDLCRGPHVENTRQINPSALKLMSVAGAYWRGDENRPMLQRVYGTVWRTKDELDQYLWRLEEAKKRDHRKLGRELELFINADEVGQGLPIWLPKGTVVRKLLEEFEHELQIKRGYQHVLSPHIGRKSLWVTSGHWDLYHDKLFMPVGESEDPYLLKPVNCPMHMMVYKSQLRSYRDLPLRLAEVATVYRREQSGELAGMLRVNSITQDDAHIFATPEQIEDEILQVLDQSLYQFEVLGFQDLEMWVSIRDAHKRDKYLGDDQTWQEAETTIMRALDSRGYEYIVAEGEAKFYGPGLDIMVRDALGRKWQCSTIQVDFQLPERFKLEYVGEDGQAHRPVVLHRAPFGSMERFFAILVEHLGGAFPVWLAPVQAVIIPIADRHLPYARQVAGELRAAGLRVEVDDRSERMNAKIRSAQGQKVPYMLVVGDREQENQQISVRLRTEENLGSFTLPTFLERVLPLIGQKSLAL